MPASRSIRIRMPDRPGALSHICIAIAAFDVNIARLDVVSQDGGFVVDDLDLEGDTLALIDRAIGSFRDEVQVQYFEGATGDPSLVVSESLETIARAGRPSSAWAAMVAGVAGICRADWALIAEVGPESRATVVAGTGEGLTLPLGRLASIHDGDAIAADATESAMIGARLDAPATWIAAAGLGPGLIAIAGRKKDVAFAPGELRRFARFASAAGALAAMKSLEVPALVPAS